MSDALIAENLDCIRLRATAVLEGAIAFTMKAASEDTLVVCELASRLLAIVDAANAKAADQHAGYLQITALYQEAMAQRDEGARELAVVRIRELETVRDRDAARAEVTRFKERLAHFMIECACPSYPCEHNPRGMDLAASGPTGAPEARVALGTADKYIAEAREARAEVERLRAALADSQKRAFMYSENIESAKVLLDDYASTTTRLNGEVDRLRAELDCGTAFTVGKRTDGTDIAVGWLGRHWCVMVATSDIMRDGWIQLPGHYPTRALAWQAALRALGDKEMT